MNVVDATEALIQANIITQGLFNADPIMFLIGHTSQGYGQSQLAISNTGGQIRIGVGELLGLTGNAQGNWEAVGNNFGDNWPNMLTRGVFTTAGFRIGKRVFRRQRAQINRGIKMLGLKGVIKA